MLDCIKDLVGERNRYNVLASRRGMLLPLFQGKETALLKMWAQVAITLLQAQCWYQRCNGRCGVASVGSDFWHHFWTLFSVGAHRFLMVMLMFHGHLFQSYSWNKLEQKRTHDLIQSASSSPYNDLQFAVQLEFALPLAKLPVAQTN